MILDGLAIDEEDILRAEDGAQIEFSAGEDRRQHCLNGILEQVANLDRYSHSLLAQEISEAEDLEAYSSRLRGEDDAGVSEVFAALRTLRESLFLG